MDLALLFLFAATGALVAALGYLTAPTIRAEPTDRSG
jgi:hypothetical protein